MTRILLVGDIHMSDRAPSSATESYVDDLIDMLAHVAKLEAELGADAVVWAGDIFHHKQPSRTSHATVLKMIGVVKLYKNLYIVTGNHDISNDVLDSVKEKQPLGILLQAGAQELVGWHPTLPLFGVPWQQRWLHEDTPMEALEMWREDAKQMAGETNANKLVVTHAPIYPPTDADNVMFELVPTHGPGGLGEAMGHEGFLYYGHIHEDHGIWTDDGVTYANMGALSRGSLHEYNLEREIKVALWTDENFYGAGPLLGDYSFEVGFNEVPIPHKPASEVFRISEVMEERGDKLSLDAFLSDVGSSTLDISSTESVVEHIRTMEVSTRIKNKAIGILEEMS